MVYYHSHSHRKIERSFKATKLTKLMAVYVVIIFSAVFMVKWLIYDSSSSASADSIPEDRENRLILLLSQPRSGSSWIGSFFDSHPDVFFVYEPLHSQAYQGSEMHLTTRSYQEQILKSLCLCEFSTDVIAHGIHEKSSKIENSRGILRAPDPETLTDLCRRSKHTVAKILQLLDEQVLVKLARDYDCQIDIVHLIRDPRASIKSRMDTFKRFMSDEQEIDEFTPELIRNSSRNICNQMVERAASVANSHDVHSYRTLIFETVSKHPLKATKELFEGLGISWAPAVEQRVLYSSSGQAESGGFETVKDSAKMAGAWRRKVTVEFIKAVESACAEMMRHFGYSFGYPDER